ncbi:aminotransferase class V-fold PLP-dependent enzyme [Pseudoroseomonas globiformis]|uniref:Aminotransferase class V-fold PLP-dependent enzyme n=1 Tax=Teichococcus globiformis TaxID=2307229 RepID=A0ABV7G3Z3_9PROT
MTETPLFDPADFRIPPGITHVCAGGETPFLHRHDAALQRYAADKSRGMPGRTAQEAVVERARARAAALLGTDAGSIGFVSSVAEGMSMLVESLDWRPGDNVCLDPDEYPSLVAPLALALPEGVELRITPLADPAALAGKLDRRTRLVAVSHVSFLTGRRYDLATLRHVTEAVGALLAVDHTQAAGYRPLDGAAEADFAFCAGYKWLLGTTGAAIAYWNRVRQPGWAPRTAGWHSIASMGASSERPDHRNRPVLKPDAMRFTRGNPAHAALYVLDEALDYLAAHDPAVVCRHVQGLTAALLGELEARGIPSTTPADPARHGASVCIATPRADALVAALEPLGVLAWGGRGRVRFSFHGYNALRDVRAIAAAMEVLW